jgi:hypothetical protein
VSADPEPVVVAIPLASNSAIAAADFYSVNSAFLAEAQRRVPRIRFKQREIFIGEFLNVLR